MGDLANCAGLPTLGVSHYPAPTEAYHEPCFHFTRLILCSSIPHDGHPWRDRRNERESKSAMLCRIKRRSRAPYVLGRREDETKRHEQTTKSQVTRETTLSRLGRRVWGSESDKQTTLKDPRRSKSLPTSLPSSTTTCPRSGLRLERCENSTDGTKRSLHPSLRPELHLVARSFLR